MCRNYHHHIVDIVDRLIGGVRSKGPHTAVNIADIAQVCGLRHNSFPWHSTCNICGAQLSLPSTWCCGVNLPPFVSCMLRCAWSVLMPIELGTKSCCFLAWPNRGVICHVCSFLRRGRALM